MFRSALFLLLAPLALSHTTFTTLYVDEVNQGDGTCVRMNHDANTATYPIEPLSSKDIACGKDGEKGVARVCPAKANSLLTFEFRAWADGAQPGSIDISHKGPCAVYMKKVDDATADNNAAGDGWFKIWHTGYDESTEKWCTEKLIDNNGFLSVRVPSDIEQGYYLVRTELLALHNAAFADPLDPQFYVNCAQIFVQGGGSAKPETVSIGEGYYSLDSPGVKYNIYEKPLKLPYPIPGPVVYESKGVAERSVSPGEKRDVAAQNKGLKPAGCIMQRDNWCGFEVPDYSDEDGCWASSQKCWDQSEVCYNTALPTGVHACDIWMTKCNGIDDACRSGDFNGPPNKGQVLTPEPKKLGGSTNVFKREVRKYKKWIA
ncbi:glycosyl hydrolase family 61-domain-containing protein [Aspergillus pseudonomiae]|uniref:AA9 family lytic polysaccharide monooxygenase n=1 Tax=Aspergillus pseudonomiae TaxID=1506151 RepID=A0A5N6I1C4_9EURO|nr:glycosyl hydrolase family 61-domain-containing protein [Aspergillus pseudonomiae]KAB8259509.1 glycosyl hydrolase family 61-domain-containing protein [Aspergillus pseudonomiae]KAE8404329.1 glycosyl hydrolase family 61-domain-containing protein [Aspergillus pseudonomiae]